MVDPTLIYVSAAIMFVVAGVFLFFVLKGNERPLPDGAFQWVASGMAVVLAAISVAMVVVTYRVDSGLMPVTSEGTPRVTSTEMNAPAEEDRKSTRLNSSHVAISYAVFCLKKKTKQR